MSVKENVELMRRWFKEVWNEGKTQTIHDILAPDGIGIGELEDGSPLRGPGEFVPFVVAHSGRLSRHQHYCRGCFRSKG